MKYFALIICFVAGTASAQENDSKTSVQLFFGRSFNGTGDVFGIEYGGVYSTRISKNRFWFIEAGGTIHDGSIPVFYTHSSGALIDGSVYYSTAGMQFVPGFALAVLKRKNHEVSVRLGAMGRYQSTSYWDFVEVIYPIATGLDFPVVRFINTSPKRTMSIGGRGSLVYTYSFTSKLIASLSASLQADSNGDLLTATSIGIGRKF